MLDLKELIQKEKEEFNRGYLEMRARIPDGKGVFSSFCSGGKKN